ncbi:MAG TPA: hypothetical protein ENH82_06895 [bacterium]|nr:hypothetical protein [bacterium]
MNTINLTDAQASNIPRGEMIIKVNRKLCIDIRARDWCLFPYPNHPKGCPNYNYKKTCPPQVKVVDKVFDLNKDVWFAIIRFDLVAHMNRMKDKHPNWSERQCKCVLYWQEKVKKELRLLVENFIMFKEYIWTDCPEAMGVNVFKTFRRLNIPISIHPEIVNKVALIGHSRKD